MKRMNNWLGEYGYVVKTLFVYCACLLLIACPQKEAPPPDKEALLIAKGEHLFFNETFNGNGRTCGTCHRREDNFGISPKFIATLPATDPLFVAEWIKVEM